MKQNGTLLNTVENDIESIEVIGDEHLGSGKETPMRKGAFDLDDEDKISMIEEHMVEIMNILGLDLNDDSLKGTPHRVAKMYVQEVFKGLNPANRPKAKMFANKYKYNEMLVEKNITVYSYC